MDAQESSKKEDVTTKQRRIAENAKNQPETSFTSLAHHMDERWLYEAYKRTRKDGAVGIDEQTALAYGQNLKENLKNLLERAKSGKYKAPPVRRVHIPKPGSTETRPIGIPTFEDKVLQRAVVMLLEPIYETDFKESSFGFRPGKSQHKALEYLRDKLHEIRGGWVIDLDIRKFFDTLDRSLLRKILAKRVRDGVIRRLIDKWLAAGIIDQGILVKQEEGTPQGGVISPLLSNIYLHEVLDSWFTDIVKPRMRGHNFIVRYADDAVFGFELKSDAERVMKVLGKRFEKYGLTIHPEKTVMLCMERPKYHGKSSKKKVKSGSFSYLGFTHYWDVSQRGNWVIRRKTDSKRLSRTIQTMTNWLKENRHESVKHQYNVLSRKLKGHYAYYGITSNSISLGKVLEAVTRSWFKWLNRRSRNRHLKWDRFKRYLKVCPLPPPRIVHSYT